MIPPLDTNAQQRALARQSQLTKPDGALGQLEALSVRLAGMTGRLDWLPVRRSVVVCAADHGIAARGVSAYPSSVTAEMVRNFLSGGAAISVLARQMNARVTVVDAGVAADLAPHPQLIIRKIGRGTQDFSVGPAMQPEQAEAAIALGREVAQLEIERGLDILVLGEMGIGNTSSSSAIIAAITGRPVEQVTGRGTGIGDAQYRQKVDLIRAALNLNQPAKEDVLWKVGGFEIATLAGLMLGAAENRIPVLVDGLIASAAALAAVQRDSAVKDYLIAGHSGIEPGHRIVLTWLGLSPLLELGLRLGEGTGAVLALPLVEAAMRTLQEMATFDSAGVSGPLEA